MNIIRLFKSLFSKNKKILIIVGGRVEKIEAFREPAKKMGLDVTLASFSDLKYAEGGEGKASFSLKIKSVEVSDFDVIYMRMIGKRIEDAALLTEYAIQKSIKLVDGMYKKSHVYPLSVAKSLEMKRLIEGGLTLPKTLCGSLKTILTDGPKFLRFPFIIKSTSGRHAREVWIIENIKELKAKVTELTPIESAGTKYFAQEFIKASQRIRVLVVVGRAVAAITRPTKWRKRFIEKVNGEFPEGIKEALSPIPAEYESLAVNAAKSCDLDVCGVDILVEDGTNKTYIIEANAAPAWKLIKKDTPVIVEEEILKFLNK
ncbi:MAG: hypothetical protein Q8L28_01555 [bacterium]|nr:hypothetical protein [bacterium]